MTKEEKTQLLQELEVAFRSKAGFYIVNLGDMNVADTQAFRRALYEKGLRLRMVKNTLIYKALARVNETLAREIEPALHYSSALILFDSGPKVPAEVIQAFKKPEKDYPAFKAAVIEGAAYVGQAQFETVLRIKTQKELLADLIATLNAPIQKVLTGLQSSGQTIQGILKTLSEKKS